MTRDWERRLCSCASGKIKEAAYDAQGIFLCYVCSSCRKDRPARFRPEILSGYDERDVCEPIDEEW